MLSAYVPHGSSLERLPIGEGAEVPDVGGLDRPRQRPPSARTRPSSACVGIEIPTREEMQEIEVSSRLYVENGARYMTATLMCQSDTVVAEDHRR